MKKSFKFYMVTWAILLLIYNLTVFLVKPIIPGYVFNYDVRFWISWGIVIVTYIGQLFCAKIAFDSKDKEKFYLNIPLITQSYTALIVVTVASSILMLIPDCPAWVTAIVCVVVFGISIVSVVKAKVAADIVSDIDNKIKVETSFIKTLTVDVESLMNKTQSASIKAEIKKVYEVVRYSDPMSNGAFASIEGEITVAFFKLTEAVAEDNAETAKKLSNEIIVLINDRNKKCVMLK